MKGKRLQRQFGGLILALVLALPAMALANEVPVVTGEDWGRSTQQERKAFLVGAATIIELEQEVQGTPPPQKSSIDTWCKGLSHFTFDQMTAAIDKWYAEHPDKASRPVVEVMWYELAKPNAGKP
ncbi:MAG: hypothetical protein AB9872_06820 [Solidesulfovibrio sp.]